jgi:hypothetical protein
MMLLMLDEDAQEDKGLTIMIVPVLFKPCKYPDQARPPVHHISSIEFEWMDDRNRSSTS